MTMSKGAVGNLINRYRAVLKKCHMLNVFGSLAVAGMLVMGGAGVAGAQTIVNDEVNVQNETVSDSSGDLDGLVYKVNDNGKLSITGGSYSGNKTARSGGVLVGTKNQAHIEIVSTVFSQNSAQYDGGAIGNFGYLTVKDSTFEGNTAQIGSDGSSHVIDNCDMGGGAIAIGSGSHVSISGSTFTGNVSGKDGGAVATRKFYGAYDTDSADVGLTVSGSTFTNNTAGKSISDTPYNYNTAITGLYESGNGGALFNTFNDTLVEGSSFTGNTAINGGAVANFYGSGGKRRTTVALRLKTQHSPITRRLLIRRPKKAPAWAELSTLMPVREQLIKILKSLLSIPSLRGIRLIMAALLPITAILMYLEPLLRAIPHQIGVVPLLTGRI